MAGAVVTYLLLVVVLGTEQEKERLIANMGSRIRDIAIPAADELRRKCWLVNGSLIDADLAFSDLSCAFLAYADLRGADFIGANLRNASLVLPI
jgi:hypothetical protein